MSAKPKWKRDITTRNAAERVVEYPLGTDVAANVADEFKRAHAALPMDPSVPIFAGGGTQISTAISTESEPNQASSTETPFAPNPDAATIAASQTDVASPRYVESPAGLLDKLLTDSNLSPSRVLMMLPAFLVLVGIGWMMMQDNSQGLLNSSTGVFLLCQKAEMAATLGICLYIFIILGVQWTWLRKLLWLFISVAAAAILIYLWFPKSSEGQPPQPQSHQPPGTETGRTTEAAGGTDERG